MSDLAWNIWGAIAGVVGTILAVAPLFAVWLHARVPSKKLPGLLALLEETSGLFETALREGHIADEEEIQQINFSIATASADVDDFRATVYAAGSYPQDVKNWWNGVSCRMADLSEALNAIRVRLVTRSCLERKVGISKQYFGALSLEHASSPPPQYTSAPPSTLSSLLQPPTAAEGQGLVGAVTRAPEAGAPPIYEASTPGEAQRVTLPAQSYVHPASDEHPTPRMVSDADLQSLLTLLRKEERNRLRAIRNEVLVLLGRQFHGPGGVSASTDDGGPSHTKRRTKRARLKPFRRLLRQCASDAGSVHVDPESLLLQSYGIDGACDDGGWCDE